MVFCRAGCWSLGCHGTSCVLYFCGTPTNLWHQFSSSSIGNEFWTLIFSVKSFDRKYNDPVDMKVLKNFGYTVPLKSKLITVWMISSYTSQVLVSYWWRHNIYTEMFVFVCTFCTSVQGKPPTKYKVPTKYCLAINFVKTNDH